MGGSKSWRQKKRSQMLKFTYFFCSFCFLWSEGENRFQGPGSAKKSFSRFGSFLPKKGPTFRYAVLFGPFDFLNLLPNLLTMEKRCQPSIMCCRCWLMVVYVMGGVSTDTSACSPSQKEGNQCFHN